LGAQADPDDDLEGIQMVMKDMGSEARRQNFELAMASGDEMATVYASTPEEMKRARELFARKVGLHETVVAPSSFPLSQI
jgi:hypothetical protein